MDYEDLNDWTYEDKPYDGTPVAYGFINRDGRFAIPPKFQDAHSFSEGMAWVMLDNKWGLIDRKGDFLIEPKFEQACEVGDGISRVMLNREYLYIDTFGNTVAPPKGRDHKYLDFKFEENGKFGVKNDKGNVIIPAIYTWIIWNVQEKVFTVKYGESKEYEDFFDTLVNADNDIKWGIIDKSGNTIIPPTYSYAGRNFTDPDCLAFHDGLAAVLVNGKWGYINSKGEMVITPIFEKVSDFKDGVAKVYVNSKMGLIDRKGIFLLSPIRVLNVSASLENGFFRIEVGDEDAKWSGQGKWGVIDKTGKWIVKPQFDNILKDCSEGMARIQKGEKFGFIDLRNNHIIPPTFNYVWDFEDDLALVRVTGIPKIQ